MGLITPELKEGVRKLVSRLSSPEYPAKSPPTVAVATMTGPQSSEARWPGYAIVSDEPQSIGGADTAPQPSQVFAASIGFAENVIFSRNAVLHDIDFDFLETKVEADWDRKGLYEIDGKEPSVTAVLIQTSVKTKASPEEVGQLVRLNDRRCPMTATLAKSATITRKLFVNDVEYPV